ncbi:hypothetical protein E6P09_16240 (plasmid) [Haloferax mediterranei ATCC 33500]|uniref:Putative transposase n=1 Tax=Haloferax mediterranei (strain ATCC 33500 / DSM 1411 / JCM 8866 / NBRC 14739 / NCIMB 2177 / R-4) TaxID=523841 RepID=M0IKE5_HALMT|nr:hypothetical protein [Haloferax mediterranei]ELZ97225.1 putative transposase [Haloferax mediterranei ATCC 33500]MDX5990037.1 hypothetical protein [Haloferax mediterranei ATCC 33500]QCQ76875.1 hypothetical protein E6P09_16240 [Haloferax mediterranei ATCC 33500]
MYLGIDVHKRDAQVAVMDEAGEIVEEVRVDSDSGKTRKRLPLLLMTWLAGRRRLCGICVERIS